MLMQPPLKATRKNKMARSNRMKMNLCHYSVLTPSWQPWESSCRKVPEAKAERFFISRHRGTSRTLPPRRQHHCDKKNRRGNLIGRKTFQTPAAHPCGRVFTRTRDLLGGILCNLIRAFEHVPQADQRQVAGSVGLPFCLQFPQVAGFMAGANFVENQKHEDSLPLNNGVVASQ